ncbi:MAG: enoyl-CoA hydratase/isomerase family protein [Acidimicrobiia bacterium]
MSESTALLELDEACGELVLNRPDKMNAVNEAMVADLHARLDEAERASVRALVVRGAGRGFCAGRDLDDANPLDEDGQAILNDSLNPIVARLAEFPAPTFCALHGPALGTGLGLALACDVVYAADDARIGSPFARIGAVLDSGAHDFLVRRVGAHRALELVYTGRLLSGREASEWGIVNRAVAGLDLVARVRAMARRAAAGPTAAFLASKRLVRRIADDGLSFAEVLGAEAAAQGMASRTDDYSEGIGAFQEKRAPRFVGA